MFESKIMGLTEAQNLARASRASGKRVSLALGNFHSINISQIKHLEHGKGLADILFVAVIPDERISMNPWHFAMDERLRMEQLASLASVDYVCLADGVDARGLIELLQPDIFMAGADGGITGLGWDEVHSIEATGTKIIFSDLVSFVEDQSGYLAPPVIDYLSNVRQRFPQKAIRAALESLANLKVLVLGDLIIDEYCYCRVSGTVSKSPVLAAVFQETSQMIGGGGVIARHAKEFAGQVHYVCTVGDQDNNFASAVRAFEQEDISHRFFIWHGTPTVTKRRYITGGYPNPLAPQFRSNHANQRTRLFEIGFMPRSPLPEQLEADICSYLEGIVPDYDLVIVADFGHGLLSSRVARTIASRARYWAVNSQTNSSNFGFNRITKYCAPDFVCIDELEARLPSGNKTQPIDDIVRDLTEEIHCGSIMVTRGSEGLLLFRENMIYRAPALATHVVDTVGAGDAVLALASLCRVRNTPDEVTALLGACAGALASWTVGNEEPLSKARLLSLVEGALGDEPTANCTP